MFRWSINLASKGLTAIKSKLVVQPSIDAMIDQDMAELDLLYVNIGKLTDLRAKKFDEGKQDNSLVKKRQMASRIVMLDKDIKRLEVRAMLLGKRINICKTHQHNESIVHELNAVKLPTEEELTSVAVAAEDAVRKLDEESSPFVVNLSVEMDPDEKAIFDELSDDKVKPAEDKIAAVAETPKAKKQARAEISDDGSRTWRDESCTCSAPNARPPCSYCENGGEEI